VVNFILRVSSGWSQRSVGNEITSMTPLTGPRRINGAASCASPTPRIPNMVGYSVLPRGVEIEFVRSVSLHPISNRIN